MPGQVLDAMLAMIDSGRLSHEDIIEELINNGMLPVEVTEFGRIPISVGAGVVSNSGGGGEGERATDSRQENQ